MGYRIVDKHPRSGQFEFYREHPSPFYSVTWEVEIDALKVWAEAHDHSMHLVLCYFMTRAMQSVEDFRYRLLDGRVALYDRLHVGTTLPTPDGQYAFGFFEYHHEAEEFLRRAEIERSKVVLDGVLRTAGERPNMVLYTSLPGVPFLSMTHVPMPDSADARPNVGFGRFSGGAGQLAVPVSLQVNHRFIGGRALGELVEAVEREFSAPA